MTPDFDANKKLEQNLKEDGEFLRDVDKGHTPTETGFKIDLGIVRDEHAEVMEDLGTVADAAEPPPEAPLESPDEQPPLEAPEPNVQEVDSEPPASEPESLEQQAPAAQAEHRQVIGEMQKVAGPAPASHDTQPSRPAGKATPKPAPKAAGRFEADAQAEHAQTIVEMGRVVLESRQQPEQPTPITSTVPEMERLSFPRDQNQTQVGAAMETVIREQAEWNATLTGLLKEMALLLRQHRLELDQLRGYLERIRL